MFKFKYFCGGTHLCGECFYRLLAFKARHTPEVLFNIGALGGYFKNIVNVFDYCFRNYAVLFVVFALNFSSALGLGDGALH